MTDQLEKDLSAVLHARATATEVPPAPIDRLVRDGESAAAAGRRRTGVLTAVAAAAAVVAVAVPVGVHLAGDDSPTPTNPSPTQAHSSAAPPSPSSPSSGPSRPAGSGHAATSLADLPQGAAPTVPYLDDGALHVGDLTLPTKADTVVARGDTVLVSRWRDGAGSWWILRRGALEFVPGLKNAMPSQISPDGRLAVSLAYPDSQHTRLTVIDLVDGGTASAPLTLNAPYATCCGGGQEVVIHGIDSNGVVYFSDRRGTFAWFPSSGEQGGATPASLGTVPAMAVTPLGLIEQGKHLTGRIVLYDASRRRLIRGPDLPVDQAFAMSPDGSLIAYGIAAQTADKLGLTATPLSVRDVATGVDTPLALPTDAESAVPVAFESDESVLIEVRAAGKGFPTSRHVVVLRCATSGRTCETAADLGPGDHDNAVGGLRY